MSPPSHASTPYIALVGFAMYGVDAEILQGIQLHAHRHGWQLFNANDPQGLKELEMNWTYFRGVIAVVTDDTLCQQLRRMNLPVVNVSDTFPEKFGFPAVLPDDAMIGRRAAEDFLARGYRHFAVHLLPHLHPYRYLTTRSQSFMETLEARGYGCTGIRDFYSEAELPMLESRQLPLISLREASLPCALFCASDRMAAHLCVVCRSRGLRVPGDIAVLGVENFALYCNMIEPPLSSIDTQGEEIGKKAVELLLELMSGTRTNEYVQLTVSPGPVVSRRSVDFAHSENTPVFRAHKFLQDHCGERINVSDIVRASTCSRRKLETDYRALHGQTLLDALNHARIQRAQTLAAQTRLQVIEIAQASGFRDPQQMYRVLARHGKHLR